MMIYEGVAKQRQFDVSTIFRPPISYTAIRHLLIERHTGLAFVTKSPLPYLGHRPISKYRTIDFQSYTKRE